MTKESILDDFLEEMSSYICTRLAKNDPAFAKRKAEVDRMEEELRAKVDAVQPALWEQIEDYAAAVDCLAGEEVKAAYLQGATDFARVMARTESNMTG